MRRFAWRRPSRGVPSTIRSGVRAQLAALAVAACLAAAPAAHALTVIANGDAPPNPTNVIDANDPPGEDYRIEPCLVVDQTTGCTIPALLHPSTSIEIVEYADVGLVEALGDSHLDVLGGDISQITLEDTSSLLLDSAFPISALDPFNYVGWVRAFDDASIVVEQAYLSAITLSGNSTLTHLGTIHGIVEVNDQASMLLAGIPVPTGTDSGVFLSGSGTLDMRSGWITDNGLQAGGDSRITMSGGTINVVGAYLYEQAWMHWTGGNITRLILDDSSVMTIAGGSFALDGVPVALGPVTATSGMLSGTLANGDPFSTTFSRDPTTQLVLVPEPATFVSLGLGLLVLVGAGRRLR